MVPFDFGEHLPQHDPIDGCLYFIVDIAAPLIKCFMDQPDDDGIDRLGCRGQFPVRGLLLYVRRQAFGGERVADGMHQGVFHRALQFTHVARPRVLLEKLHCFRRHALYAAIEFPIRAGQKIIQQQRQILDPFTERRDANRQHV